MRCMCEWTHFAGLFVTSYLRWCQQSSQGDTWRSLHLKYGPVRISGQKTEHFAMKRCIKLMDQISNYGFEVESPVILVFVHSCHIDSLSLSLGTRVYCSLALKTCRHSTCQLSLAVLSCELWKAGCLADKNHASQRFYCTEPWTDVHKATDFIPSAHIWEQYLSPV